MQPVIRVEFRSVTAAQLIEADLVYPPIGKHAAECAKASYVIAHQDNIHAQLHSRLPGIAFRYKCWDALCELIEGPSPPAHGIIEVGRSIYADRDFAIVLDERRPDAREMEARSIRGQAEANPVLDSLPVKAGSRLPEQRFAP